MNLSLLSCDLVDVECLLCCLCSGNVLEFLVDLSSFFKPCLFYEDLERKEEMKLSLLLNLKIER